MAPEPVARTHTIRRRWLLIAPPVVLLFGRGLSTLVQIALGDLQPERLVLAVALAIVTMVAALLLLAGGRIGWLLAVAIIGWNLALEIALWWGGSPDYIAMALLTLCAFLVTSPEMRAAYVEGRAE